MTPRQELAASLMLVNQRLLETSLSLQAAGNSTEDIVVLTLINKAKLDLLAATQALGVTVNLLKTAGGPPHD